jgi:hypothetical protein
VPTATTATGTQHIESSPTQVNRRRKAGAMQEVSRRGLLKIGAFAGAAASVVALPGIAHAGVPQPTTQATQATQAAHAPETIEMTVTQLRSLGDAHPNNAGDPLNLHGVLVAGPRATGEFVAHGALLGRPNRTLARPASMQTQLFTLAGGTITGMGMVDSHGAGAFTITGGTGTYAHVRGSYTSTQHPNHTRGGSGRFVFTLYR